MKYSEPKIQLLVATADILMNSDDDSTGGGGSNWGGGNSGGSIELPPIPMDLSSFFPSKQ